MLKKLFVDGLADLNSRMECPTWLRSSEYGSYIPEDSLETGANRHEKSSHDIKCYQRRLGIARGEFNPSPADDGEYFLGFVSKVE